MVFDEVSVGEGVYAADENNFRNSSRGAFVRNGGNVTVGASSQDIVLNIDACDIRIQTTDWSIASGTVTLADNATAYPRRDLVFAKKGPTASDPGSFEVATGTPIDAETMQTLVSENVVNQDGTPIAKPEDIPEVQPPAFKGHRDDSTLLAMVYVPPGTSDSTAIAAEYITDLRMEGIGVTDVLRTGDAINNIEAMTQPLDVTATNSEALGGISAKEWKTTPAFMQSTQTVPKNTNALCHTFFVPANRVFRVWQAGITSREGTGGTSTTVRFRTLAGDNTPDKLFASTSGQSTFFTAADEGIPGPQRIIMDVRNQSSVELTLSAHGFTTMESN